MKYSISVLALVVLLFVAGIAPATAGTVIYDNGAYNGTEDAYTINFGFVVSEGFTTNGGTATGANFVLWQFPGNPLTQVDWAFGASPAGTDYGSGTATASLLSSLGSIYGYDLASYAISFPGVTLTPGTTYWFSLQNAVAGGNPIYWDENDGPAAAFQTNGLGTIGSETFQITGDAGSPIPEPASFGLLGLGLAGMAGFLHRRASR